MAGYADNEYGSGRPVDYEGRKKPIIPYTPNHNRASYVTQNETIVEHVRAPPTIIEYKYSSPKLVEVDDYAVNKWRRPSSPIHDCRWRRPSSPIHDRRQEVEEFGYTRPALLGGTNWRNPNPTNGITTTGGGNGEYNNFNNNSYLNKPNRNSIQDDEYDNNYLKNKPATIKKHGGWTTSPANPLTRPTNDIGEAVELLKDAANSLSNTVVATTRPRFTLPTSTMPKTDSYTETIDSREAARRYGNLNPSSRPLKREETYTGTIDSREALKRYGGTFVP